MKKFLFCILAILSIGLSSCVVREHTTVAEEPTPKVYKNPAHNEHYYIYGYWTWRHGHRVFVAGHWSYRHR